ncbi:MAG: cytochrome c oxidase subunit II [Rhizobiales bacterium]|nr:cytochrome c oxidase subunit II [Hyphomicrobiales bacterium]
MRLVSVLFGFLGVLLASATAFAAQSKPWQIWHQEPGSEMMADIVWFDAYTFWFIIPITIFVTLLLAVVAIKFNAKANPTPSKTTHHVGIEIAWTLIPILILVAISIPSFDLLNRQLAPQEEPTMTIKATGYQWYWGYEYQDGAEVSFESVLLRSPKDFSDAGKVMGKEYPRLLAVDNELVVPVNQMIRVTVTAADVIHDFALPAFGLKIDAVPGRLNETWFKAEREGLYYGQCSELCGKDHAYMPIAIRVVSQEKFDAWKAAAENDLEAAYKGLLASN